MTVVDIHTKTGMVISRLDLAKQIAINVSSKIYGEQALMTVNNWAKLELPLTKNNAIFQEITQGITPLFRGGWSSIVTPIEIIRLIYGEVPNLHIIWITDGEFFDSWSTLSGFIVPPNITFIGVGTIAGGPILEWYTPDGFPKYKQSQGEKINSIRDDKKLKKSAQLLDADIFLRDDNLLTDIQSLTQKDKSTGNTNSWLLIFWFLLTIVWFVFPRYQYLSSKKTWK